MDINNKNISSLILSLLSQDDKYISEIATSLQNITNGEILLKQTALYKELSNLEKTGFVLSYWRDSKLGGKRHYYKLTDLGKMELSSLDHNSQTKQQIEENDKIDQKKYDEIDDFQKIDNQILMENNRNILNEEYLAINENNSSSLSYFENLKNPKINITCNNSTNTQTDNFITEHVNENNIPKVKKIAESSLKINTENNNSLIINKIEKNRYLERINSLYNLTKNLNIQQNNNQEKLDTFEKPEIKVSINKDRGINLNNLKESHYLFAKYFIFLIVGLVEIFSVWLICFLQKTHNGYDFIYLIYVVIISIPLLLLILRKKRPKTKNIKPLTKILLSSLTTIICIILLFSINMLLFDFNFTNMLSFGSTFVCPCILSTNFILVCILDIWLTKKHHNFT